MEAANFSVALYDAIDSICLLVKKESIRCGFFMFLHKSTGEWEQHTILSDMCRGKDAIIAGNLAINEMVKNGATKFVSYCFEDMPHTLWYAKKLGYDLSGKCGIVRRNNKDVHLISVQLLKT
jgi:hypothetical protein